MSNASQQKALILCEAQSAGIPILHAADLGNTSGPSAVAGALTAVFGGTLHAGAAQVVVFGAGAS